MPVKKKPVSGEKQRCGGDGWGILRGIQQLVLTASTGRLLILYWTRLCICMRQDCHPSSRPPRERTAIRHRMLISLSSSFLSLYVRRQRYWRAPRMHSFLSRWCDGGTRKEQSGCDDGRREMDSTHSTPTEIDLSGRCAKKIKTEKSL